MRGLISLLRGQRNVNSTVLCVLYGDFLTAKTRTRLHNIRCIFPMLTGVARVHLVRYSPWALGCKVLSLNYHWKHQKNLEHLFNPCAKEQVQDLLLGSSSEELTPWVGKETVSPHLCCRKGLPGVRNWRFLFISAQNIFLQADTMCMVIFMSGGRLLAVITSSNWESFLT